MPLQLLLMLMLLMLLLLMLKLLQLSMRSGDICNEWARGPANPCR
jgi:hypothetical protein